MKREEAEQILREAREAVRLRSLGLGVRWGKTSMELMDTISFVCRTLDAPATIEAMRIVSRTPLMELTEETFREETNHAS